MLTWAWANFLDHWEAVAKSGSGKRLPYKIEMAELNVARVGFKHQGVSPAVAEAEKQRVAAHRFLVEVAQDFFGVDFDDISEADLIVTAEIRLALKNAESALTSSDPSKSLECCREALDCVENLMKTAVVVSEDDPFGPRIPREVLSAAEGFLQWTRRRFAALEKSVTLSVLRVNPAEYWFLHSSLPRKTASGGFLWSPARSPISTKTPERASLHSYHHRPCTARRTRARRC
jgi:hypothetical protein